MSEILFHYERVDPTSWAYLSSLLLIGLFFKFGRFWSVRNLDIVLLIMFAPGLLLVDNGQRRQHAERWQMETALSESVAAQKEARDASAKKRQNDGQPKTNRGDNGSSKPNPGAGIPAADAAVTDPPNSDVAAVETATGAGGGGAAQELTNEDLTTETLPVVDAGSRPLTDGQRIERLGFAWLLGVSALLVVRLLMDPTMVRRPLLDPNLSAGGLAFIGCSLLVFLTANVINRPEPTPDNNTISSQPQGPGYALLEKLPTLSAGPSTLKVVRPTSHLAYTMAQVLAILSHLAIVAGMALVGYKHFDNIKMGIGASTIYLMLPYMAQMTGCVDHALPAAMLVLAVVFYRRPLTSGIFIGLSVCGYYPLFLLPLWVSFYWQRGLLRFLVGFASMLVLLSGLLVFASADISTFFFNLRRMYGIMWPAMDQLGGVWGLGWYAIYRIPLLTAFVALSASLAIWPAQKNLGTLLSCSGAVMVATQFWHGQGGGLYMAWYLPMVLLTIFRPNLEDRVALSVLREGWFPKLPTGGLSRNDLAA